MKYEGVEMDEASVIDKQAFKIEYLKQEIIRLREHLESAIETIKALLDNSVEKS